MPIASDQTGIEDRPVRAADERRLALRDFALRRLTDCELHRLRLSRILHDELGQSLLALNLDLYALRRDCGRNPRALSRLGGMRKAVEAMGRTVRKLAANFTPAVFQTDLGAALTAVAERFHAESGLECRCRHRACQTPVSQAFALAVHRILLQALHCAAAAGVRCIELSASVEAAVMTLVIVDAEPAVRENSPGPVFPGLQELIEWIEALQGEFRLQQPGHSQEIGRVVLPLC